MAGVSRHMKVETRTEQGVGSLRSGVTEVSDLLALELRIFCRTPGLCGFCDLSYGHHDSAVSTLSR